MPTLRMADAMILVNNESLHHCSNVFFKLSINGSQFMAKAVEVMLCLKSLELGCEVFGNIMSV
jgi:hypothetical protein